MSEQDEAAAAAQAASEQGQQELQPGGASADGAEQAPAGEGAAEAAVTVTADDSIDVAVSRDEAGVQVDVAARESAPAPVIPGAPPTAQPREPATSVPEAITRARVWIQDQRRWSRVEKGVAEQTVAYLEAVLGA